MTPINVPQLGESVSEATVGRWRKSVGDSVRRDEILVELETDKVSVDVPCPVDGVLSGIAAREGDVIAAGSVLGEISPEAKAGDPKTRPTPPAAIPSNNEPSRKSNAGESQMTDVKVPPMGESVSEGTLSALKKKAGDAVKKDEAIAEIETDKVAMEVFSPEDGVVKEWLAKEGDSVAPGSVIARIQAGAGASAAPAAASASAASATTASASVRAPEQDRGEVQRGGEAAPVSPAVRRIAAENNANPADMPASGKDGRVTKGDALAYLETRGHETKAPAAAKAPRDTGPREERVKMTRLRQTIARRLKEAQDTAAMLTTFNDVDMTAVMELRKLYKDVFEKKHGVKLGFMGFFVKACVHALKEIPAVNAEIDGTDLIYKNYYDLGIAVGTEKGLVVPVVRDCDELSIAGVEKEIAHLGAKARDGSLSLGDLQGGTFTITNGGVYGSLMSTPILNPPQSGVLGMHRIEQRPVAVNGQVVIRPMMYLALSYDHRIVDGKEAVTFLVRVKESLENPERLLLDL